jgi:branched chain amino acid efflux pump
MPENLCTALAVAVSITGALRTIPFIAKSAIKDSPLVADLGSWMPLGAVTILAVYCLLRIDMTGPTHGAGP